MSVDGRQGCFSMKGREFTVRWEQTSHLFFGTEGWNVGLAHHRLQDTTREDAIF